MKDDESIKKANYCTYREIYLLYIKTNDSEERIFLKCGFSKLFIPSRVKKTLIKIRKSKKKKKKSFPPSLIPSHDSCGDLRCFLIELKSLNFYAFFTGPPVPVAHIVIVLYCIKYIQLTI